MSATASEAAESGGDQGTAASTAQTVTYGVICIVAVALFLVAGQLPASRWEPLGAGAFPRLVLGALAILAAIGAIDGLRRRQGGGGKGASLTGQLWELRLVFAVTGCFGLYILALKPFGFALASFLFLLVTQALLGPWTRRRLAISFAVAVVFSFGLNLLFAEVFNVFLPRGRLFG